MPGCPTNYLFLKYWPNANLFLLMLKLDKIRSSKKNPLKVTCRQNSDKLANYLYWFPIPLLFHEPRV